MGRKRKKKGQKRGPRRKRMRRPARLASARAWLPTYGGRNVVRGYARWYGVDPVCAIRELRLLGVSISDEYEGRSANPWNGGRRPARRNARRSSAWRWRRRFQRN